MDLTTFLISKFLKKTFYLAIENEMLHLKYIERNTSISISSKIAIKNDIVIAIGENVQQHQDCEIFNPFKTNEIIFDDIDFARTMILYLIQNIMSHRKFGFLGFHLIFYIDKKSQKAIKQSEIFLLQELAKQVGAIKFAITQDRLLTDEEILQLKLTTINT